MEVVLSRELDPIARFQPRDLGFLSPEILARNDLAVREISAARTALEGGSWHGAERCLARVVATTNDRNIAEIACLGLRSLEREGHQLDEASRTALGDSFSRCFICDREKRLAFLPIPKNASTFMKAGLIRASSDWKVFTEGPSPSVHRYVFEHGESYRQVDAETLHDPSCVKAVILRNPFGRIVSGYFDKFVKPSTELIGNRTAFQILGQNDVEARSKVTFADFVNHLNHTPDALLDRHFRPQSAFMIDGLNTFELVGQFEKLDSFKQSVGKVLGAGMNFEAANVCRNGAYVRTAYMDFSGNNYSLFSAAELRTLGAIAGSLTFPRPRQMYSPTLLRIVQARFAEDFDLYQEAFGERATLDSL